MKFTEEDGPHPSCCEEPPLPHTAVDGVCINESTWEYTFVALLSLLTALSRTLCINQAVCCFWRDRVSVWEEATWAPPLSRGQWGPSVFNFLCGTHQIYHPAGDVTLPGTTGNWFTRTPRWTLWCFRRMKLCALCPRWRGTRADLRECGVSCGR